MSTENFLFAIAGAVVSGVLLWLILRNELRNKTTELKRYASDAREMERKIHVRESDFLNEKNKIEAAKTEASRLAREQGYQEGREFGQAEHKRDHLIEITELRTEFSRQLLSERDLAASSARDKLRAEYELQTKLFTVKICPYLRIIEDKSFFNKKHEVISGYQYQLLINGIPAFSPHIVPERTEIHSEINPELERVFLGVAEKAADAAINLYLGGNLQFAKIAPAKIEKATR